jgi:hypothetical protein
MDPIHVVTERIAVLRSINSLVLGDGVIASSLSYKGFSLWSCEQQLIWERLGRAPSKRRTPFYLYVVTALGIIIAFISSLFLIVRMRCTRSRILIYSIDCTHDSFGSDIRIAGIYRLLIERGISYGELFHTDFGRGFFMNIIRRKRVASYLDIARLRNPIRLASKQSHSIIADALRNARSRPYEIFFLRIFLRLTRVRVILAIDDTRYYYPLMIAAKECGVPFYAFQHGRFNEYIPGWSQPDINPAECPFPDGVFVWNDYWRNTLIRISPVAALHQSAIRVAGKPSVESDKPLPLPIDDGVTTFLIPHEEGVSESSIREFITRILSSVDTRIIYKLRKGRATPLFVEDFKDNPYFECLFDIGSAEWARTDAVLGAYSTFLYEALAKGRPVGILQTNATQALDLVMGGFAGEVYIENALPEALRVAATPWDLVMSHRSVFACPELLDEALSAIMPL